MSNQQKRVLLIAEKDFGDLFTQMLAAAGVMVDVVECYRNLDLVYIELLKHSYDMVIPTNNAMSADDIPVLVSKIKRDHPGMKIIVLSGIYSPEYVSELQHLGIDEFMPLGENEMIARIKKQLFL